MRDVVCNVSSKEEERREMADTHAYTYIGDLNFEIQI